MLVPASLWVPMLCHLGIALTENVPLHYPDCATCLRFLHCVKELHSLQNSFIPCLSYWRKGLEGWAQLGLEYLDITSAVWQAQGI